MEPTREPRPDVIVALNRKARHDYFILESFECGLVLMGTEIKAVRAHKVNLKDSYAKIIQNELWLENCHISPWEKASWGCHEPLRRRKLLLHKAQLRRLFSKIQEKGLTLIPLKMYLKGGRHAKIELALVRGKTYSDRRQSLKIDQAKREMARELRNRS